MQGFNVFQCIARPFAPLGSAPQLTATSCAQERSWGANMGIEACQTQQAVQAIAHNKAANIISINGGNARVCA